jgi:hypothetical protein
MKVRSYVALAAVAVLAAPTVSWAGKLTCLTGTEPSVANDANQLAVARARLNAGTAFTSCDCATFDGSPGKTNAAYRQCVQNDIDNFIRTGFLRPQCKHTLLSQLRQSTCGAAPSTDPVPCVKKSVGTGRVTCAIKPRAQCVDAPGTFTQVDCAPPLPVMASCVDTADTNYDGRISAADGGTCARMPATTPTPAVTPGPRFADNGDGTISDTQTGLMWEKKDRAGGLHDVNNIHLWGGDCSDGGGLCQPDGGAAATCVAATGNALGSTLGCAQCAGLATCATRGLTTIWQWLNQLNAAGLGGHSDWRIPSVSRDGGAAQLETIADTTAPGCRSGPPCVPALFNTGCSPGCSVTGCSCTAPDYYWSATTYAADPHGAWGFYFFAGFVDFGNKFDCCYAFGVRAVR